MHYIGIDPGAKGFIVVLDENGAYVDSLSIEGSLDHDIVEFLKRHLSESPLSCAMEQVGAMPGQGVSSMFTFGRNYGFLIGVLTSLEIPYTLIRPHVWQRSIWISSDHIYGTKKDKNGEEVKKVSPKPTSIRAASRLFPNVSLKKTERCKVPSDGKADALLIALYAKRNM